MHYEPNWKKSEFNSGNLKSIDFNEENRLLSIIEYQGNRKEVLKQVPADKIREIKFVIHHNTGRGRSVAYLDIVYLKNVRNGRIVVYLPLRYDKSIITELQGIAQTFDIPFYIENNTGSFLGYLIFLVIVVLISIIFKLKW